MQLRRVNLRTADGLNPTPMSVSWARDGVLVCAMDNEIAVYSQWREDDPAAKAAAEQQIQRQQQQQQQQHEHRNLKEKDILNLATVRAPGPF